MDISEIRDMIFAAQHGYCNRCQDKCTELHHRLPNTKTNRKLFPMYLNSPFNFVGLCKNCHDNHKEVLNVSEDIAVVYESWLKATGGEVGRRATGDNGDASRWCYDGA